MLMLEQVTAPWARGNVAKAPPPAPAKARPAARETGARNLPQEIQREDRLVRPLPSLREPVVEPPREAGAAQDSLAAGLLDALSIRAVGVDAASVVRFASAAGLEALRRPGSGIAMRAAGPGRDGSILTALHQEDATALRRLIAATAQGGPGGTLRIRPRDADVSELPMQAAFVMPAPVGLGGTDGLALVVIEDLVRRAAPPASMLCDLFGLSRSEAEVAVALVGGASAEDVAEQLDVSTETVRNQIRAILRKSEMANLRDFERVMATLAAVGAEAPRLPR